MTESPYDPVAVQAMLDKIPAITIEHCAETIIERDRLKREVVGLRDALTLCIEALEAVEWEPSWDYVHCPWCQVYGFEPLHHENDCQRQRALAAAKGDPSHN